MTAEVYTAMIRTTYLHPYLKRTEHTAAVSLLRVLSRTALVPSQVATPAQSEAMNGHYEPEEWSAGRDEVRSHQSTFPFPR